MRNVYDLLNDVETSLDDYDVAPLTELEQKRLQYKVKRVTGTKKNTCRWMGAACAAVLAMGFVMLAPADSPLYAAKENAAYHIGQFMGIDRNLDAYTEVIGSMQSDNGYTIQLNEVILDRDTLLVSTNIYKEDGDGNLAEEVNMGIPSGDLYINGRDAAYVSAGSAKLEEDGESSGSLMEFHMKEGIDTSGKLDMKLVYHNISLKEGSPSGKWVFHFTADGSALAADTQTIPVDYRLVMENNAEIRIADYTGNVLGQRIAYSMHGDVNCDLKLEGVDNKGNHIVFISSVYEGNLSGIEGHGYLQNDMILGSAITEDTQWLSLTPYLGMDTADDTGRIFCKYEPAGEPFTIFLQKPEKGQQK